MVYHLKDAHGAAICEFHDCFDGADALPGEFRDAVGCRPRVQSVETCQAQPYDFIGGQHEQHAERGCHCGNY